MSNDNGIRASEALHATPRRARRKLGGLRASANNAGGSGVPGISHTPKAAKRSFSFSSSREENAFAKSLVTPLRTKSSLGRLNINRRRRNTAAGEGGPLGDNQTISSELRSVVSMDFTNVSANPEDNSNTNTTSPTSTNNATTNAALDFTVNVLQGEDLVGLTSNIFGTTCSSDPYVIVSVMSGSKEVATIGTTKHQSSTLNPKWNAKLTETIPPSKLQKQVGDGYNLQIKLMNYDFLGDDSCMGIVKIPLKVGNVSNTSEWYDVPPCEECPKATGRIQVAIETKLQYTMDSFFSNNSSKGEEEGTAETEASTSKEDPSLNVSSSSASSSSHNNSSSARKAANGLNTSFSSSNHNNNNTKSTSAASAVGSAATTAGNLMAGLFGMATSSSTAKKEAEEAAALAAAEKEKKDKHQIVGICEEEEVLSVMLTVHQGDSLVAKDRNAMGRFNSSDPYVVVEVWPRGAPINEDNYNKSLYPKLIFGRSKTIPKTLSPQWQVSFDPFNVPLDTFDMEEAQLRVRIMDDDFGDGEDDPMGNIDLHLQPKTMIDIAEKWYPVSRTSASRASGRVQISLLTLHAKQKKVVGTKTVEIEDNSKTSTALMDDSTIHGESTRLDSSRRDNHNNDDGMETSKRFSFIKGDHSALGNALLQADRERRSKGRQRTRQNRRSISNIDGDTLQTLNALRSMDKSNLENNDDELSEGRHDRSDNNSGGGKQEEKSSIRRGGKRREQQQQQQQQQSAGNDTMEDASAITGRRTSRIRRTRSSIKDGTGPGSTEERNNSKSKRSVSRQRSHSVAVTRTKSSSMGSSEIIGGTSSRRRESLEMKGGSQSRERSSAKDRSSSKGREKAKKRSSTSGPGSASKPRSSSGRKKDIANDSNSSGDTETTATTTTTTTTTPPESPAEGATKAMASEEKKKRAVAKMGRSLTPRPTKQRISRSKSSDGSAGIQGTSTRTGEKKRRPLRKSSTLDEGDPRLRRPSSGINLAKALDVSDFVANARSMDAASVISGASGFSRRTTAEASVASAPTISDSSGNKQRRTSSGGGALDASHRRKSMDTSGVVAGGKNGGRRTMTNASSRMDASGISRNSINGSGGEGERRKGRRRSSVTGTNASGSSSSGKPSKSSSKSGATRNREMSKDGPRTPRRRRSCSVQKHSTTKKSSSGKRLSMAEVPDLKSIDDNNNDKKDLAIVSTDTTLLHLAYGGQTVAIPSTS